MEIITNIFLPIIESCFNSIYNDIIDINNQNLYDNINIFNCFENDWKSKYSDVLEYPESYFMEIILKKSFYFDKYYYEKSYFSVNYKNYYLRCFYTGASRETTLENSFNFNSIYYNYKDSIIWDRNLVSAKSSIKHLFANANREMILRNSFNFNWIYHNCNGWIVFNHDLVSMRGNSFFIKRLTE